MSFLFVKTTYQRKGNFINFLSDLLKPLVSVTIETRNPLFNLSNLKERGCQMVLSNT